MTANEPDAGLGGIADVNTAGEMPEGWAALFRRGNVGPILVLTGGVLMHALSLRVVATVMPSAVAEIGGLRFFAWASAVAFIGAIWGASLAASLAITRGLRGAYWISLMVFAGGSALCATAPGIAPFLAGRLLQGSGGGLLTALAYTTIRRVFPPNLHSRAITIVSGIWSVGALCGPFIGGVFAGWGLWRWAFWIDIPVAVMIGASAEQLKLTHGPAGPARSPGGGRTAFDRLALLGGAAIAVSLGGISGRPLASLCGLITGFVLLVATLRLDNGTASGARGSRLLPKGAFDPRSTLGAVSLSMALMAGCTTGAFYVPYLITVVGGRAPIEGGYLSTVVAVSWTAAAFAGAAAKGGKAEALMVYGPILQAAGLISSAWAVDSGSVALIAATLIPVGAGVGLAWAHLGSLMIACAREEERDLAGAFISTLSLIAQAFAVGFAGIVANLAGFADPALGAKGVVRGVFCLFLAFSLLAAAAAPASISAIRQAKRN